MSIIRVALDVPVNTLFDYLLPDDEVTRGDVGARVRVPFGKNALTGVIMEVIPHPLVPTQPPPRRQPRPPRCSAATEERARSIQVL